MNRFKAFLIEVLNILDPSPAFNNAPRLAPCPDCHRDVWAEAEDVRVEPDLTYVRCKCGSVSAWADEIDGPQLIWTSDPVDVPPD